MKINDQLALTNTRLLANQPESQDFEQWINRPTKQNSGDEYYWQHQEQLQQSDLHFAKKTWTRYDETQLLPTALQEADSVASAQCPALALNREETTTKPSEHIKNQVSDWEKPVPSPIQFLKTTESIASEHPESVRLLTPASEPEKSLSSYNSKASMQPLKNHHLFIQEEEAELTFNSQELNQKEQRELTMMLKNHLKQKGITLKQLIINGVKND